MKMRAEDKAKWIEALESGKYSQTKAALYRPKDTGLGAGFCCLGVIQHCTMDGMVESKIVHDAVLYNSMPSIAYAHRHGWELVEWKAYDVNDNKVKDIPEDERENCFLHLYIDTDSTLSALVGMNDGGKNFKSIADYIKVNVGTY